MERRIRGRGRVSNPASHTHHDLSVDVGNNDVCVVPGVSEVALQKDTTSSPDSYIAGSTPGCGLTVQPETWL